MYRIPIATCALAAVLLAGCATTPMGPTALVMPAPGKPFDVFAGEQASCKQFAGSEVDGGATVANLKEFGAVALSTALGAGLGEAVRGRRGAEIGGGVAAAASSAGAARGSARDQNNLQGRYDLAYIQCMYSHGNKVATAAPRGPGVTRAGPNVAYGAPGGYPVPSGGTGIDSPLSRPDPYGAIRIR